MVNALILTVVHAALIFLNLAPLEMKQMVFQAMPLLHANTVMTMEVGLHKPHSIHVATNHANCM